MPNYGVIDLGSNSIRLVVYKVPDTTLERYYKKDFSSLLNDKMMRGLAAYVYQGNLSDAGIKRAIKSLQGHLKRASYFQCDRVDIFATAALRNANNRTDAVRTIQEAIDYPITIIQGDEEAHLGYVGTSCEKDISDGLLVDIGGGSTEMTYIQNGREIAFTSIPIGSLSSYTSNVQSVIPTAQEMQAIRSSFNEQAAFFFKENEMSDIPIYGIGGSIRALAKLQVQTDDLAKRPSSLTPNEVDKLIGLSLVDPNRFAHLALTSAAERVHTVTPGGIILSEICRLSNAPLVEICKCGVREGYLIERMLQPCEIIVK